MSCQRAREVDLEAFVADRGGSRWATFVDHYPRCIECSAEVEEWSELFEALGAHAPSESAHPTLDALLTWCDAPDTLEASHARRMRLHIEGCESCGTQVEATRGFAMPAPAPAAELADRALAQPGPLAALRGRLADLLVPSNGPAFAFAALLVLALGASLLVWRFGASDPASPAGAIRYAETPAQSERAPSPEATASAPASAPATESSAAPAAQTLELVAESSAPTAEGVQTPVAAPSHPQLASEGTPQTSPTPAPARPEPAVEPHPILLAANFPVAAPVYDPSGLPGTSLESLGIRTLVRARSEGQPEIHALGPEHLGATASASPTLYWHLSQRSQIPIEIVVSEENAIDPLLEFELESPIEAGVHALELEELSVVLNAGVTYRWFVTLVPDRIDRNRDIVSGVALRYVPPSESAARRIAESAPAERAHRLASEGYWYDSFELLSDWLAAEPDAGALRAHRQALLEQVGIEGIEATGARPR